MLGRPRSGAEQGALNDALALLGGLFHGAGHAPLAPPHMFLGETLLDLYGEDLRARAFLFADAGRGNELCLRPDFTVPVALAHAARGWETPAAYAYQGPVFRSQPPGERRPVEYLQAGIERFGEQGRARADARVFALLHRGLAALGIGRPAVTLGDLAIPFALLDGLALSEGRRAALRRHFWRPGRFQDLLRRAEAPPPPSDLRRDVLAAAPSPAAVAALMTREGEPLGRRTNDEIAARAARLAAEATEPPLPASTSRLIGDVLSVTGPAPDAAERLRRIAAQAGVSLDPVLSAFETRLGLIEDAGIPTGAMHYDAAFGRNLEYYDGFVFEIRARGQANHPPLAGGGRYDSLTVKLGADTPIPAIGGMIRPEAVLEARA